MESLESKEIENIAFTQPQIVNLFPFHIIFDVDYKIIQLGRSMQKLVQFDLKHDDLFTHFKISEGHSDLSFEGFRQNCNQPTYIELLGEQTIFKGSFYQTAVVDQLIFIGQIKPDDLMHKYNHKISLSDFPMFDSFNDYLFSLRVSRKAYEEVQFLLSNSEGKLMEREKFNKELEQKVTERTRELNDNKMKLENALENEKKSGELKTEFISNASHQFRTPLAIIQSNSELLEMISSEFKDNVSSVKVIARIKSGIKRMTELMDDMLILGKINSGNVSLKIEPQNVVELCLEIIEQINMLQKDGREIDFLVVGEPETINADKNLLGHALTNLLNNALKYSEGKNNPQLELTYLTDRLIIKIIDKGIGIPQGDIPNLFQPFYRGENAIDIKGTGLGLSIVKNYVELNNGVIELESSKGETVFTITFKK